MGHFVCAVVVTYHPSASMLGNIAKFLTQVQGLVVVDNGSDIDELNPLRAASQNLGFQLIENGENLGIAEALNTGVRWAIREGYPWVILFDQDSQITDELISQMLITWELHPNRELVSSIHPRYVTPDTGIESYIYRAKDGGPVLAVTSGALMPTWIFSKVGFFASEYFIDMVDWEYCLRMRAAGYLIADSRKAVLLHAAGHPRTETFMGYSCRATHHSATRRYYISRNRIVFHRKYFRRFPRWILHDMNISLRETIKCFLFEEDRVRKFRNLLLGTWDGLTGKMGKKEGI